MFIGTYEVKFWIKNKRGISVQKTESVDISAETIEASKNKHTQASLAIKGKYPGCRIVNVYYC